MTIYAMYIPIFIMIMVKEKSLSFFNRYLMPFLSICACIFMMIAACYAHGQDVIFFLIIYAVVMVLGMMLRDSKKKNIVFKRV